MVLCKLPTRLATSFLLLASAGSLFAAEARLLGAGARCLGIGEAPASLAPVLLEDCAADNTSQRFALPPQGFAGEVRLGGLCLDVDHSQEEDGTKIQLFGCHGGANQRWQHDGEGRLVGLGGKCLDVGHGASLARLFTCDGGDAQSFLAQPYEAWAAIPFEQASGDAKLLATSNAGIAYQYDGSKDLLRTVDGGRTWALVNHGEGFAQALTVDWQQPERLWRITDHRQIWRSEDGGRTWRIVAEPNDYMILIVASKVDPSVVVAAGRDSFWLSQDHGQTFVRHGDLPPAQAGELREVQDLVENAAGEWIFAELRQCGSAQGGCAGKLYVSSDLGLSWQPTFDFYSATVDVVASPADRNVLYTLLRRGEVFRSEDGGHHFAQVGSLPASQQIRFFDPHLIAEVGSTAEVWAAYDGGLWGSEDGGASWSEKASELTFDAGWTAYHLGVLGQDALLALSSRVEGRQRRALISRDGGDHWAVEAAGIYGGAAHLVPAAQPGRFYASALATASGDQYVPGLWRSDDYGRRWREILPAACVLSLAADKVQPDTFYFGTSSTCIDEDSELPRGLLRSRDAGLTFESVGLQEYSQIAVAAIRHGATSVLLAADVYNNRLLRSTDGGDSWQLAFEAPGGILRLFSDGELVYFATYEQTFRSADGGVTWAPITSNFGLIVGGGKTGRYRSDGKFVVESAAGTVVSALPGGTGGNFQFDAYGRLYYLGVSSFRSLDDGRSWQSLDRGRQGRILEVVADPFDQDLLLASTGSGPIVGRFAESTLLSLGKGRFTISVTWHAPDGAMGRASGKNLSDDSGAFYFFTPERKELVVKVLDGRSINGRFWVFLGSLTDVEFEVEVVDEISGETWSYRNPQGHFASFGDTEAFPRGVAQPSLKPAQADFYSQTTSRKVVLAERFEVEVTWQAGANHGFGLGTLLSGETSAFTFFSPTNVELLVNVLDGRPINGHYWIFAGSLSNVAYTVRVRDLETGVVKEYDNEAGSFASIGDTLAF